MTKQIEKDIANHLYDLIKVNFLSKNQNDDYAELSRKFAQESKAFFKTNFKNKYINVENNKISIGERNPVFITISIN